MMDLADIRKKARAQDNPVVLDSLLPSELITADILPSSSSLAHETNEHCFWNEIGTEQFSTEEEYSQGLTGAGGESDAAQVQWLSFYLGNEEYALDIQEVSELIKPRDLTELPQVPSYLCGIITLRGEVIPVVDLKVRLGLVSIEPADIDLQRVVVCEGKDQRVGLLVDQISQVVCLPADSIETPQLVGDGSTRDFVLGVGRKQGRMLIQLHPEKIIEIEENIDR